MSMSPLLELNNANDLVGLLVVSHTVSLNQDHELTEVVWKSRGICIIRSKSDQTRSFMWILSVYEMHDISLA